MKIKFLSTLAVFFCMLTFSSCTSEKAVTLSAVVDKVYENSLMVTVAEKGDFDKASVGITEKTIITDSEAEKLKMKDIKAGNKIEIEFSGEVRESYPVQITADKITIIPGGSSSEEKLENEYKYLSPEEAKERLDADSSIILLDVRTPEENAEKRIPGSTLLPDYDIVEKAEAVLPDKSSEIFVYCRSGRRSEIAARLLLDMGYTNVYDIGGIIDWPYETEGSQE